MFNTYLEKVEVQELLKEIFNNPKYYVKTEEELEKDNYFLHERILLLFYDALYKFKLIIDDEDYLIEFISGFESLIKKLDKVDDIKYGISKLIGKITCSKLNINNENEEDLDKVLEYIYDKYIKNGYYIRGLNKKEYIDSCNCGIVRIRHLEYVEVLKTILNKYNYNLEDKDKLDFNTNMGIACLKSINSPKYLYNLLVNNKYISKKDVYYLKSKKDNLDNLNILLNKLEVNKSDKKDIVELFNTIWDYYNSEDNNIYLVLIKRSKFSSIDDYKRREDFTFDEALYNIFNAYDDLEEKEEVIEEIDYLIELPSYYKYVKNKNNDIDKKIVIDNEYGMTSIFMIIGTLSILLGVILTLIFI